MNRDDIERLAEALHEAEVGCGTGGSWAGGCNSGAHLFAAKHLAAIGVRAGVRTRSGRILTDAEIEREADWAEGRRLVNAEGLARAFHRTMCRSVDGHGTEPSADDVRFAEDVLAALD